MGLFLELRLIIEAFFGFAVGAHEEGQIRIGGQSVEMGDEHPELGAPVADMVEAQDVVAEELEETGNAVADDRGAEMAYMELFGDVGRGELDDHPFVARRGNGAEARILELSLERVGEEGGVQGEINEAGASDRHLGADLLGLAVALVENGLGDGAGILAKLLGELERAIALVVAEFFLDARGDLSCFCEERIGARDRFA